uniref:Uncharacterized protein n=1 Tax=Oryza sativa subsp. japonica TaxID=39947 RepID=Q5VRM9_ORYSJ|nr:hypothetical protein [Oryza sativa Japonica Group]BAD67897.1 hypothetical protein [Oryza sativa Japonica Group]
MVHDQVSLFLQDAQEFLQDAEEYGTMGALNCQHINSSFIQLDSLSFDFPFKSKEPCYCF